MKKNQFDSSDHALISAYFFKVWRKKKYIYKNEKKEIACLKINENN